MQYQDSLDPRAIDPQSGLPIGFVGSTKVQSRELCFPFKIVLAKDCTQLYEDHFRAFFDFFAKIEKDGYGEFRHGFLVSSPQDESSFWKSLNRGGACKVKKEFCRCCACHSEQGYRPKTGLLQCQECQTCDRAKCFHWQVGDVSTLARLRVEIEELKATHGFLMDTTNLDKMKTRLNSLEAGRESAMGHIDYEPDTAEDRLLFGDTYINPDLQTLGLSRLGSVDVRRERLRGALGHMERLHDMERMVGIDYSGAFILIDQAIPCILHCEN